MTAPRKKPGRPKTLPQGQRRQPRKLIVIDPAMHLRLERVAELNDRTLRLELKRALDKHLAEEEKRLGITSPPAE